MPETTPDDERTVVFRPRRPTAEGLLPGTILGNTYRIEALLARGGMGEVYRARHVELGTLHAVKVILPSLADDPKMGQLLVEEARKLARLRHPAIVEYEGLFRDARGLRYLVMELVEGESLAAVIERRRLEPAEVLALCERLAQGLSTAHERGVIHRDVSPENILLPQGEVGRAKLIDFGIAKAVDAEATIIGKGAAFAGKYAYASPEQLGLFGGRVDLRSDIYSLGLVLANAAIGFGRTLDMGNSLTAVLDARAKLPDLAAVPAELRPVIAPMLAPNPESRPPSMRALLQPPAAAAAPAAPAPAAAGGRKMPTLALAGAGAAALVIVALLALFRTTIWPPSVETLRTQLAAATSGYDCAKIRTVVEADRSVTISGHAASEADVARLRQAVGGIAGIGAVTFDVHELVWPYCRVVHLLQPYTDAPAGSMPTLALAAGPAYTHQRLAVAVGMPDFDGYLYVDYFVGQQKQVLHVLPNGLDRINLKPAHNRFVLGRPPSLTCWTLPDLPGEQLVTAIVSTRPLFTRPPPDDTEAYLKSLAEALGSARRAGAATLFFDLQQPQYPNPTAACPAS